MNKYFKHMYEQSFYTDTWTKIQTEKWTIIKNRKMNILFTHIWPIILNRNMNNLSEEFYEQSI